MKKVIIGLILISLCDFTYAHAQPDKTAPDQDTEVIEINNVDTETVLEDDNIGTGEVSENENIEKEETLESNTLTCQGKISYIDGVPLAGDYEITFSFYDREQSEEPLWIETQTVSVCEGLFRVQLGQEIPLELPFNQDYWLGITVGDDMELNPRLKMIHMGITYLAEYLNNIRGQNIELSGLSITENKSLEDIVLNFGGNSNSINIDNQDYLFPTLHQYNEVPYSFDKSSIESKNNTIVNPVFNASQQSSQGCPQGDGMPCWKGGAIKTWRGDLSEIPQITPQTIIPQQQGVEIGVVLAVVGGILNVKQIAEEVSGIHLLGAKFHPFGEWYSCINSGRWFW